MSGVWSMAAIHNCLLKFILYLFQSEVVDEANSTHMLYTLQAVSFLC